MSTEVAKKPDLSAAIIESVLLGGDLSRLTPEQRVSYYKNVCDSVGLNPLTKPFEYIQLNGKLVLYAKKDCTDQLRKLHRVSCTDLTKEVIDGVLFVRVKGRDKDGREDVATGAVTIANLKGDALANAMMKGETKAKRRLTLSICGLGFVLDETELETIPPHVTPNAYGGPTEEDGGGPGQDDYRIPFGKFAKRKLEEVDTRDLGNYVDWLEADAKKKNKQLTPVVQDFIQRVDAYITAMENTPIEGETA